MSAALSYATAIIVASAGSDVLKTTAIVSAATVIVALWRGASAAQRHTVWLAALIVCGVTVLTSAWAPELPLHVSRRVATAATQAIGIETSAIRQTATAVAGGSLESFRTKESLERSVPQATRSETSHSVTQGAMPWPTLIALVWFVGVLSILIRLTAGWILVSRAAGCLRRVTDPAWQSALHDVASKLAVRRDVALVFGPRRSEPVTFGIARPTIVVPTDAVDWSEEQRRLVLLHEVAHIARGDLGTQLLADVVCALLWFQPLMWIARSRLRAAAESAADDVVLSAGVLASVYADRLLDFARLSSAARKESRLAVGFIGMLTSCDLERRFEAMLNKTRSRSQLSRRNRWFATLSAVAAGMVAAGLRLATPAAATPAPLATAAAKSVGRIATAMTTLQSPKPVRALAVPPRTPTITQALPNLSGTWVADTQSVPKPYRVASLPLTITVLQTQVEVAITMHGRATLSQDGAFIEPTPDLSWTKFVPLDGTVGVATLFGGAIAGKSIKNDELVRGAWHGDTLVMTTWKTKVDSAAWKQVDRLTLTANGSLEDASSIFIGQLDTLSSLISFAKAR